MTTELDMTSISGLLEYLAYQGKTGDQAQQLYAYDVLRGTIDALPSAPITVDDAITLQALAITIVQALITNLDRAADAPPEAILMRATMSRLLILLQKAGTTLESVTGAQIDDRQFFRDMTPTTVQ